MDAKEITLIGDIMGTDGVQALSIRPNAATAYGTSGLSAGDLKLWFDKVPTTLVKKIDEVIDIINDVGFAEYIKTDYEGEPQTLADVFKAIRNGDFAVFLQARQSNEENGSLQDILDGLYKSISDLGEKDAEVSEILSLINLPEKPDGTIMSLLDYIGIVEDRLSTPNGEVKQGETKPVSGDAVFNAIKENSPDVSSIREDVNILRDVVTHNEKVVEKHDKRLSILEMANEGNTYAFTKHEDIEYNHPVPPTALPYARLDSIGGYTRRSKNLLKLTPNMSIPLTGDELPITYSTDEEGYFCIDGDGGVSGFFDCLSLFVSKPSSIVISARYIDGTVSGPAEGVDADLVLLGNTIKAPTPQNPLTYLAVSNVKYNTDEYNMAIGNFTNYKIALMVEEGTTATEYEPYYEGLKSAKVTAVKSYGKNLMLCTVDGVAYTEFELDGKYFGKVVYYPTVDGQVTFSWKYDGVVAQSGGALFEIKYEDGTSKLLSPTMTPFSTDKKIVSIWLRNWCNGTGRVYDIQLERGDTATEYSPYSAKPIDTYDVPMPVQSIDGYGLGVLNSRSNFFDESTKRFGKNIVEVVLTGNETIYSYEYEGMHGVSIAVLDSNYNRAKGVCSHANVVNNASVAVNNMWLGVSYNANIYWLGIMDLLGFAPTNLTKFKEYLAKQYASGTPVRIIYVTTNPDSMSYDFVDGVDSNQTYLNVEANGYIVGENAEGIESNIGITFQEKL